jgi:hypothetical protein
MKANKYRHNMEKIADTLPGWAWLLILITAALAITLEILLSAKGAP